MVHVRLTRGTHRHDGEVHETGAEFDLPEHTYERLSWKFEALEAHDSDLAPEGGTGEAASAESGDEGDELDPTAFVGQSWQTVVSVLEAGDVDDYLGAIEVAEHEREAGPRDSVLDALEGRAT